MDVNSVIKLVVGPNKRLPTKSTYADSWLSWYRGKVLGFHDYKIYNGDRYLEGERKSLGMAKKICEDFASLLMNEKCDIVLPENPKKVFDEILRKTNFWQKANEGVEKSFALGFGAMVVGVKGLEVGEQTGTIKKDKASVTVNFVNRTKIVPITIEDKEITECAFVSKNSDCTNIVIHVKGDNGNYIIHNYKLDEQNKLTDTYLFDTKSSLAWFQIIRPNISSNFMTEGYDEEIAISVFANSIDTLKALDNKYDSFDLEYVLGRKKTFISADAWKISKEGGKQIRTFDPYDSLYYHLPENNEGKPLITNKADDLRYEAYIRGINTELSYLTSKCGMGETYYKFDGSGIATATQIISENSSLYRTLKKHELILENVLINLTKVIIYVSNEFTSNPIGIVDEKDINIIFDDSIIEDKETEMLRDRQDVLAGLMSKVEYRMRWYGEDEKTAKAKIKDYFLYEDINNYVSALQTGAINPELFVEKVYGEHKDKSSLIQYISEFVQNAPQVDMSDLYAGDEQGKVATNDEENNPN